MPLHQGSERLLVAARHALHQGSVIALGCHGGGEVYMKAFLHLGAGHCHVYHF
jgi:hypothetical protein